MINNKYKLGIASPLLLVVVSCFFMSSTKCEKEAVPQGRLLKKNVKIIGVEASTFLDNSGFSFSEVAQNQMSGVLSEQGFFFERNIYPTADEGVLSGPQNQTGGLQKIQMQLNNDAKMLMEQEKISDQVRNWFPSLKSGSAGLSRESACLISRPQHLIYAKINSLEASSGSEFQFGFNQNLVPLPISGHYKIDKMRMDISVHSLDPWIPQHNLSHNDQAYKKDYSYGFGIDIGPFSFGPSHYEQTGLAEVTLQALKNGVSGLAKRLLTTPGQDWKSRVYINNDNQIAIVGGHELGIQVGDQFVVENEVYDWSGEPCAEGSQLIASLPVTNEPWIVEVDKVGDNMSRAKVLNPRDNESINIGALVRIHKLYEPPPVVDPKEEKKEE